MIPDDLHLAFHEGDLQTPNGIVPLHRCQVADLILTTGRIVVRDALIPPARPFKQRVSPGKYPVWLSLVTLPGEQDPRPAYATVEFAPGQVPPTAWEQAVVASRAWWWRNWNRSTGFPVDSWHAGVMDIEANTAQNKAYENDPPEDPIGAEHNANNGLWNVHRFPNTPANMVTFFTGLGSGVYECYFGRNPAGVIVCLTVHLDVLTRPDSWPPV